MTLATVSQLVSMTAAAARMAKERIVHYLT
jgi:hypothetical protein